MLKAALLYSPFIDEGSFKTEWDSKSYEFFPRKIFTLFLNLLLRCKNRCFLLFTVTFKITPQLLKIWRWEKSLGQHVSKIKTQAPSIARFLLCKYMYISIQLTL